MSIASTSRRRILRLASLACCLLSTSTAFAGQVQTLFVSSSDLSTILSGPSSDPLTSFAQSPGNSPTGLAVDSSGVVYAGFAGENVLRGFDSQGGTLFQTSTPGTPYGLAFDHSGHLLVVEQGATGGGFLGVYSTSGRSLGIASTLDGSAPYSVAVDSMGRIFYSDLNDGLVRQVGSQVSYQFQGESVIALTTGSAGSLYLAVSGDHNGILAFNPTTLSTSLFVDLGAFQASGLAFNASGNLFVSGFDGNSGNYGIESFSAKGASLDVFGSSLLNPTFLAFSPALAIAEPATALSALFGVVITMAYFRRRKDHRSL